MLAQATLQDKIAGGLAAARACELMTALKLEAPPRRDPRPREQMAFTYRAWAIADALLQTYLREGKRLTAAEWGEALRRGDLDGGDGGFDYRTVIELLREGMHPRITGMYAVITAGALPLGLVVGLYNAADPAQAFIDAYDLACVSQRERGAEGPAVLAAAIAEAVSPDATYESVIEAIKTALLGCGQDLRRSCLRALRIGEFRAEEIAENPEAARTALAETAPGVDWRRSEISPSCLESALLIFAASEGDMQRALTMLPLAASHPGLTGFVVGAVCGALAGLGRLPEALHDTTVAPAKSADALAQLIRCRIAHEKQTLVVLRSLQKPAQTAAGSEPLLFSKIFGSTVAGAIGNCMGSVVENQDYPWIDQEYGRIETILDPRKLETEDDLQMALHLCQAFIEKGGVATARDFARIWKRDLVPERFFYCMRTAYELILAGHNPRYIGHTNIVTGSTLMCMQPVGFYNAGDPEKAFLDAIDISYMYQRGLDVDAACVFAAAVAEAVRPRATVQSVCQTALDYAPTKKLVTFDRRKPDTFRGWLEIALEVGFTAKDVFDVREAAYARLLQYAAIDPLEFFCMTFTIFAASRGKLREAVIGGTNIGRDADSISSLNGVLAGALHGYDAIPREWRDLVGERALAEFRRAAQGMTDLVFEKKAPGMQRIQKRMPR